jgi:membrane associated rhomboid family serine protease
VAWWAHIGGFVAGLVLIRLLAPRRPRRGERRNSPQIVEVIQPNGEVIRYQVDR